VRLTDADLRAYDTLALRIKQTKRKEYLSQVDNLIDELKRRVPTRAA
jgi:hypothetical protein